MDYNRKFHVSTQLASLFGEKYADHILVGKKYWWFFDDTSEVYRKTNTHWNKLEITYIRAGIVFYKHPKCHQKTTNTFYLPEYVLHISHQTKRQVVLIHEIFYYNPYLHILKIH